jgi:hypothetical protein
MKDQQPQPPQAGSEVAMAGEWLMFFDRDDAADIEDSNLQTGFVHGDLTFDQIADLPSEPKSTRNY